MPAFNQFRIDTRQQQLDVLKQQGVDGIDLLERHRDKGVTIDDLKPELQKPRRAALRDETAAMAADDTVRVIDAEALVERQRVEEEIAFEQRAAVGSHVKAADVINVARLKESDDIGELRAILEAAKRAGGPIFDEAVAIARPRLQRMAATEMGIRRSVAGGSQLTSGAFALLNDLPTVGATSARQRLDAVERRRQDRRRRFLEAAAVVDPELPRLIQTAVLKAAVKSPSGDPTLVVGPAWDRRA